MNVDQWTVWTVKLDRPRATCLQTIVAKLHNTPGYSGHRLGETPNAAKK